MPNWCINHFIISHKNRRVIRTIIKPYNRGWLWGGDKYFGVARGHSSRMIRRNTLVLEFETAWAPPLVVLDFWVDIGFDVKGDFFREPDGDISGTYKNKRIGRVPPLPPIEERTYWR
jgi:hypothetical protein